jgi:hypothetical protein
VEPARRPDLAGRIKLASGERFVVDDGTLGPTTLIVDRKRIVVPAGTRVIGGCQGMYTSGIPCVGQVGLDNHGRAQWVTVFVTEYERGPGPLEEPRYNGGRFRLDGTLQAIEPDHVLLRDGTWIPSKNLVGHCNVGSGVEVTVDPAVNASRIDCLGRM